MKAKIAALCLLAFPAVAQTEYSIPWFQQNTAARHEALRMCRNDYRMVNGRQSGSICANAEAAEARRYAKDLEDSFSNLNSPEWWSRNPALRQGALTACARRAPYDRAHLPYCDVVRRSAKAT